MKELMFDPNCSGTSRRAAKAEGGSRLQLCHWLGQLLLLCLFSLSHSGLTHTR